MFGASSVRDVFGHEVIQTIGSVTLCNNYQLKYKHDLLHWFWYRNPLCVRSWKCYTALRIGCPPDWYYRNIKYKARVASSTVWISSIITITETNHLPWLSTSLNRFNSQSKISCIQNILSNSMNFIVTWYIRSIKNLDSSLTAFAISGCKCFIKWGNIPTHEQYSFCF